MQSIPLQAIASQTTKVVLNGQSCQLYIYQKLQGLFVDVALNGVDVSCGVIAHDVVPLISRDYAGFSGNLIFTDTQGNSDPFYQGLGTRFDLVYLTADEYALLQQ